MIILLNTLVNGRVTEQAGRAFRLAGAQMRRTASDATS
jgi:hypothetical protein